MPNWCETSYAVRGPKEQISRLYNTMVRLQKRKTPLVPNGFGVTWLGCLVKKLGGDPQKVYCRGDWRNLRKKDPTVFYFDSEHAWSRPYEVEELIHQVYPELEIYFLEEELGMDIFQTNDTCQEFFDRTVIIDEEDEGMEYYTMEDALKRLSELKGEAVPDWEAAEAFADAINAAQDASEGCGHIWLHKVDYC